MTTAQRFILVFVVGFLLGGLVLEGLIQADRRDAVAAAKKVKTSEEALVDYDRRCTAVGGVALLNVFGQQMCLQGRPEMVVPFHFGEEGWSR